MLLASAVLAVLAVNPVQVVVLDARVTGVDPGLGSLAAEEVARSLPPSAFKVTTATQLNAVLGLERQRQLLGCDEGATSCVAELASALGADIVAQTTVTRVGNALRCNLTFVSGRDGAALERLPVDASSESALLDALRDAVSASAAKLFAALRPGSRLEPGQPGFRRYFWVPAAVGALGFALGGALYVSASSSYGTLTTATGLHTGDAQALVSTGKTTEALAWAFMGLGIVGVAAAAVVFIIGAPSEPKVIVGPVAGAGGLTGLAIAGVWP